MFGKGEGLVAGLRFSLKNPQKWASPQSAERAAGESNFVQTQLSRTDRNGKLGALVSPLANWASDKDNGLTRPILEAVAGIDKRSELPKFHTRTFSLKARGTPLEVNRAAPAFGRKAASSATCFVRASTCSCSPALLDSACTSSN